MPTKAKEPAMPKGEKINPMVLDLSHHNQVLSFAAVYEAGIRGIIHKVTEGLHYVDPTYSINRELAKAAGLLWGAYHFFRPNNVEEQVEHFLRHAAPEPGTLLALDHEDEACSGADAIRFLQLLEARTGRLGMLYSGHLIKDQLGNQVNEYLGSCRLWHAQYGTQPHIQASWDNYWLWQFTDGETGPNPHRVPGVTGQVDINSFRGTEEDLISQWVGGPIGMAKPGAFEWVSWGQATLNLLGNRPKLIVDGAKGSKTAAVLEAYQKNAGVKATGDFDEDTVKEMLEDVEEFNGNR